MKKATEKLNLMAIRVQNMIKKKLNDTVGADGSIEKGGWIIIALIIVGLAVLFINSFFPEFFKQIEEQLSEMFSLIKYK